MLLSLASKTAGRGSFLSQRSASRSVALALVAGLLFMPAASWAQRPELAVSNLKSKVILKRLFNAQSFDTSGAAMWKPNFADSMEFESNIWCDGYCHTKIDTILTYHSDGSTRRAFVVFCTISEDGCMYCYPNISVAEFLKPEENDSWSIEGFKKNLGSFGGEDVHNGPRIALRKAGPQTYL